MEILGMVLLVLFAGVTAIALLAAIHLLFPRPVENARQQVDGPLARPFLLGLVNILFFVLVGVELFSLADWIRVQALGFLGAVLVALALIALAGLAVLALNGLSALASLAGLRIGKAGTPFLGDLRGGLLLVLACATPFAGWYFFTPVLVCLGVGASIMAFFQARRAARAVKKTK
jgi:hypothetical protein